MKKLIFLLIVLIPLPIFPQISGIINTYTKVTAIDPTCSKITVASTSGFNVGDTVLIIQMKGATMDETSNNSNYGNISAYNDAGNYEFTHIKAISGNDIYLKNTLLKTYTPSGRVQLVTIPSYTNVTITGTLTAQAWDGDTGGVLVFKASGTVTFNADIDVSGLGFRGNPPNANQSGTCSISTVAAASTDNVTSSKGEGIKDFTSGKENGYGKQANGGGGGNSNNAGGGGGGNFNTGGKGGRQSSGCGAFAGAGSPGLGGAALTYSNASSKIFLGGAGGAGHQNNYSPPTGPPALPGGTPGGNGGGIVIVKAKAIDGMNYTIHANGNSPASYSYGDGAGGGGSGGTVLLSVPTYNSMVFVEAKGGKGSDAYDETGRDLGPGGGGSGGALWISLPGIVSNLSPSLTGGAAGISTRRGNTTVTALCECNNQAVAGSNGGSITQLVIPESNTPSTCSLPVEISGFTAFPENNHVRLGWTTAWERDNQKFLIDKSQDLESFYPVAEVAGRINSSTIQNYTATDTRPFPGLSYYRLLQQDLDGTITIAGLRAVNISTSTIISAVYPNPFTGSFTIDFNPEAAGDEPVSVDIYNSLGEKIYESSYKDTVSVMIPLNNQASGVYYLVVYTGTGQERIKLVKNP